MNLGPTGASAFLDAFLSRYAPRDDRTVILFPSALSFASVHAGMQPRPDIRVGVQNIHTEEKGAYTGENSAAIAADAGASFVLVGHSERRHVFGETDAQAAQKCARAVQHGLTPVLCVGELLEQRERGETEVVVLQQLRAGISMLLHEAVRSMIIAYEPVWAIGTGLTPTPADVAEVHGFIRERLTARFPAAGQGIHILYGGSVKPSNAKELMAVTNVDGALVGGASLKAEEFLAIAGVYLAAS
jgi:triosephosphate isomerase